jgi:hypothetical protein
MATEMTCVLRAIGSEFDVDTFLADSPLRPEAVYRKGEPVLSSAPQGGIRTASGFNLGVSQAGFDDLPGQVRDAVEFLDEYEDELRRLGKFPGVEAVVLDCGVRWRDVAAQTDVLPAELLWRAGALDIDITVTHYAIADEKH